KESAAGLPHDAVVFTNEKGMTLYTSDADSPGKSMCVDDCAKTWIPALAPANADTSVAGWSVVTRADGSKQWAYHGKPLYTFVKDVDVGSVGGNSPAVSGRGPMVGPRGSIRG